MNASAAGIQYQPVGTKSNDNWSSAERIKKIPTVLVEALKSRRNDFLSCEIYPGLATASGINGTYGVMIGYRFLIEINAETIASLTSVQPFENISRRMGMLIKPPALHPFPLVPKSIFSSLVGKCSQAALDERIAKATSPYW
jgi:hypothetical protein